MVNTGEFSGTHEREVRAFTKLAERLNRRVDDDRPLDDNDRVFSQAGLISDMTTDVIRMLESGRINKAMDHLDQIKRLASNLSGHFHPSAPHRSEYRAVDPLKQYDGSNQDLFESIRSILEQADKSESTRRYLVKQQLTERLDVGVEQVSTTVDNRLETRTDPVSDTRRVFNAFNIPVPDDYQPEESNESTTSTADSEPASGMGR